MPKKNSIIFPAVEVEWRDIPDYSAYQASSEGYIRRKLPSVAAGIPIGYILKSRPDKNHGNRLSLSPRRDSDGKFATVFVHVLVALAFFGPKPSLRHQVDHKNRIQDDNRPSNLRWVTPRENQLNANHSAENSNSLLTWREVKEIRRIYPKMKQVDLGKKFGVSHCCISNIVLHKTWKEV